MEILSHGNLQVRLELAIRDRRSVDPDFIADQADAADVTDLVFSLLACGIEGDAAAEGDRISTDGDTHVFVLRRAQGLGGRGCDGIRMLGEANG